MCRKSLILAGLVLAALPAVPAVYAQRVQGPEEPPLVPPSQMRGIAPEMRRYQIPVAPPAQPEAAQPAPAPSDAQPGEADSEAQDAPAPAVAPTTRSPIRPRSSVEQPELPRTTLPRIQQDVQTPIAGPTQQATSQVPAPAEPVLPPPAAATTGEPSGSLPYWPYLLALIVGLGLGALVMQRMRRREEPDRTEFQLVRGLDPAPEPAFARPPAGAEPAQQSAPEPIDAPSILLRPTRKPEPAEMPASVQPPPEPEGIVGIQLRPRLELDFRPARAAATEIEATVQYELTISNIGNEVARNVRLEARMFNAGSEQEDEIRQFFATSVRADSKSRILAIPARNSASMRGAVSLPKELVREIELNGRRLFIPTVAIHVCYEWGDGKIGQTSMSYIVGREPDTPSSKMGPFRLDLGPRIYRQVGHRPSQPELVV